MIKEHQELFLLCFEIDAVTFAIETKHIVHIHDSIPSDDSDGSERTQIIDFIELFGFKHNLSDDSRRVVELTWGERTVFFILTEKIEVRSYFSEYISNIPCFIAGMRQKYGFEWIVNYDSSITIVINPQQMSFIGELDV